MVSLICPATHEPLEQRGDHELVSVPSGHRYPIVSGIPILLPGEQERTRIASTDWSAPGEETASPLGFYNAATYGADHRRDQLELKEIIRAREESRAPAREATLEIGAGGGRLQGVGGDDYVALDYGFTAMRDMIDPKYQRICATAEALPFPAATFAFVYSVDALEHVPRVDLAFAEIDRVLQPGGVAFVAPAWHCRQYVCDGVPFLPYEQLSFAQKLTKRTLPIRENRLLRAAMMIPQRVVRRIAWAASGRRPTDLHWRRLRPMYGKPLGADSDAAASIDSHEGCLFFHSRNYDVLSPGPRSSDQLLARHINLIVRKPG
jgi:SAM-dependent methyltransferase/uncharacterized protein YbaR (Trm112 family)